MLRNTALNQRLREEEVSRLTTLSQLSHELKKPLSIIRATLDRVQKARTVKKQTELLVNIDSEVGRATELLDDIIVLNQLEIKQVSKPQKLDLSQLCQTIYKQRTQTNIEHKWSSQIESGIHLTTAPEHIFCILENLLDNAAKYTPTGGQIELQLTSSAKRIELVVRDTGIGLTPASQKRILEPFYRTRDANKQASGTGLGLAIVAQAVSNLGGELTIESQKGKGSAFQVVLPSQTL